MTTDTIKAWEVSLEQGAGELILPAMSSLDAITRQLPQGFYTTFRTYDGGKRVLGLRAHLQRLYGPAADLGIRASVSASQLRRELAGILRAFPGEARVRLQMDFEGRLILAVEPLKPVPEEVYSRGVKVVTTGVERRNPRLKSTAFISASQSARDKILADQAYEGLLVRNGSILEGMTSNFFYVKNGILGTARRGILLGVTRRTVLRVARGRGLEIVYKPLKVGQVQAIDEAFLTSSSRGIVPVVQVDGVTVGEGRPGPATQRLMKVYDAYVLRTAEVIEPHPSLVAPTSFE
jgi:branched-chain amino acid aminotransferase